MDVVFSVVMPTLEESWPLLASFFGGAAFTVMVLPRSAPENQKDKLRQQHHHLQERVKRMEATRAGLGKWHERATWALFAYAAAVMGMAAAQLYINPLQFDVMQLYYSLLPMMFLLFIRSAMACIKARQDKGVKSAKEKILATKDEFLRLNEKYNLDTPEALRRDIAQERIPTHHKLKADTHAEEIVERLIQDLVVCKDCKHRNQKLIHDVIHAFEAAGYNTARKAKRPNNMSFVDEEAGPATTLVNDHGGQVQPSCVDVTSKTLSFSDGSTPKKAR